MVWDGSPGNLHLLFILLRSVYQELLVFLHSFHCNYHCFLFLHHLLASRHSIKMLKPQSRAISILQRQIFADDVVGLESYSITLNMQWNSLWLLCPGVPKHSCYTPSLTDFLDTTKRHPLVVEFLLVTELAR